MTAPARTRRAAILPWQARLLYEIGLSHLDTLKAHNSQNALPLIPQLRCLGDGTRSPRRRRCESYAILVRATRTHIVARDVEPQA